MSIPVVGNIALLDKLTEKRCQIDSWNCNLIIKDYNSKFKTFLVLSTSFCFHDFQRYRIFKTKFKHFQGCDCNSSLGPLSAFQSIFQTKLVHHGSSKEPLGTAGARYVYRPDALPATQPTASNTEGIHY